MMVIDFFHKTLYSSLSFTPNDFHSRFKKKNIPPINTFFKRHTQKKNLPARVPARRTRSSCCAAAIALRISARRVGLPVGCCGSRSCRSSTADSANSSASSCGSSAARLCLIGSDFSKATPSFTLLWVMYYSLQFRIGLYNRSLYIGIA